MLVRLLLAVLTAAGPMPVGACTCAAAGGSESQPATTPAAAPVKTCGCKDHDADSDARHPADLTTTPDGCCGTPADHPARPDHHDRDCPAATPRPAVMAAAVTAADDLPADSGPAPTATSDTPALCPPAPATSPVPGPPPLPLYLSLRSLRI